MNKDWLSGDVAGLHDLMQESFSIEEVKGICFDLGIDHEELRQSTKSEFIQELIIYCQRRGRIHELIQKCHVERPNPDWATFFPVVPREYIPVFYQKPGIANQPPRLVGRDTLLTTIRNLLTEGKKILLHGLAGSGKTALATMVAESYLQQGSGAVIWFEIKSAEADPLFDTLAQRLGNAEEQKEIHRYSHTADVVAVRAMLNRYLPALLVLDDAWNAAALRAMLQAVPPGMPVIVTSRLVIGLPGLLLVEVGDLAPPAALALLSLYADHDYSQDSQAQELCRVLAYHPYALEIGGALAKIDGRIRSQRVRSIARTPATITTGFEAQPILITLLRESYTNLTPANQTIFRAIGGLFTSGITPELLTLWLQQNPDTIWQALDDLVQHSLARRQSLNWLISGEIDIECYTFHDLTFSFARLLFQEQPYVQGDLVTATKQYVQQFLQEPQRLRAEIANILAVAAIARQKIDQQTVVEIITALTLYGYIDTYGYSAELLDLLDVTIEIVRSRGEQEIEHLHYLLGKRANAYFDWGKLELAHQTYLEALASAPNLRRQTMALAVLGKVSYHLGNYTDGDSYFARGHEILSSDKDDVALGFLLQQKSVAKGVQKDFEASRAFASGALDIHQRFGGELLARLLYDLLNLGTAEFELGNQKAIAIHEEGYALSVENGRTRQAADFAYTLGRELHALGQRETARRKLVEAVNLYHEAGEVALERDSNLFMKEFGYEG